MGRNWTQEEIDTLTRMYPDHYAKEIAGVLGRGVSSIYCKARQLGLECNPEKIQRTGFNTSRHPNSIAVRFKKGQSSWNKGKKMSPEVYSRVSVTMFKKGNIPTNQIGRAHV